MAIERLTRASILTLTKYANMMAGEVYSPPGDYELISSQILGTAASSVTFSGLATVAASYKHLQIRYAARSTVAAASDNISIQFNGDTAANYTSHILLGPGSTTMLSQTFGSASYMYVSSAIPAASSATNNFGPGIIDILDWSSSSKIKSMRYIAGTSDTSFNRAAIGSGFWNNSAALSQITFSNSATFIANSRFSLYGLR